MTVYDFIRTLVGAHQRIAILDYEEIEKAGSPTLMYSGICWKCPYSEEANKDCTISQKQVEIVEAEGDTLIIGINFDA